ncbi:hypothetical protein CDL15_Pgr023942 [Punica granatum]|uniref:Uncharacterized protein n=1 Tax=Punica granatum TaxID=22663 RepID=A0A218XWR9_PUNGR|nr:hypothetical protein CDL15_Pgr023942 [Punica granatum]
MRTKLVYSHFKDRLIILPSETSQLHDFCSGASTFWYKTDLLCCCASQEMYGNLREKKKPLWEDKKFHVGSFRLKNRERLFLGHSLGSPDFSMEDCYAHACVSLTRMEAFCFGATRSVIASVRQGSERELRSCDVAPQVL